MNNDKYKVLQDFEIGEQKFTAGETIVATKEILEGAPEGSLELIPATKPSKDETVTVPKSLLEEVLSNQKKLEEGMSARDKEIERLTYAADKSRLGIYDSRNASGQLIRKLTVGLWEVGTEENKKSFIVRGWKMVADEVNMEDNGGIRRLVERQVIRLFLDQGTDGEGKDKPFMEVDVDYVKFYRQVKRLTGEVIKESRDDKGDYRTLRFDDGRTVEMDIRFVNI